jgi:hypothetical protein
MPEARNLHRDANIDSIETADEETRMGFRIVDGATISYAESGAPTEVVVPADGSCPRNTEAKADR